MQRALYISPALPRRHGAGLSQRVYRVVDALSQRYRVSLLTTDHTNATAAADALAMCEDVTVLPIRRSSAGALARRAARRLAPSLVSSLSRRPSDWSVLSRADERRLRDLFDHQRFDLVHVHRLYMLPLLQSSSILQRVPSCLDLDDIESMTRERFSALARSNGHHGFAYVMQRDAEAYRALERRELAKFERVLVCSDLDRDRLLAHVGPRRVDVLPNAVEVPEAWSRRPRASGRPSVFLFVGDQSYYPNGDAIAFLCREIVPLLRLRLSRPFEIRIVSSSRARSRQLMREIPEVSWAPPDADLAQEYGRADAAIIPIRAGGGTRIKALEAFAHRTAVVSTPIGIEGLAARHGKHALIGETAADLATHAAALVEDTALRDQLVENAFMLVQTAYSPTAIRHCLDEIYSDPHGVAESGVAALAHGAA